MEVEMMKLIQKAVYFMMVENFKIKFFVIF